MPRKGQKHTKEAIRKMIDAKKGKTWEQLHGVEKAKEMKQRLSNRIKGKNHPLYGVGHSTASKLKMRETALRMYAEGKMIPNRNPRPQTRGENNPSKRPEVRKIISQKQLGKLNSFYGKRHSKETKEIIRKKGKGKRHSEKTKQLIRKSKTGKKRPPFSEDWKRKIGATSKQMRSDPEFKSKMIRLLRVKHTPNKPETFLINFFKKHNLPYKFVGNGQVVFGRKCPDFINVNGEKKIIEHFGKWWHKDQPNIPFHQTEHGTIDHYKKFGFKTLVIWQDELKDKEKLLEKITNF